MAKSDLQARPIYHRTRDSIRAHLTIVFAALAVTELGQLGIHHPPAPCRGRALPPQCYGVMVNCNGPPAPVADSGNRRRK